MGVVLLFLLWTGIALGIALALINTHYKREQPITSSLALPSRAPSGFQTGLFPTVVNLTCLNPSGCKWPQQGAFHRLSRDLCSQSTKAGWETLPDTQPDFLLCFVSSHDSRLMPNAQKQKQAKMEYSPSLRFSNLRSQEFLLWTRHFLKGRNAKLISWSSKFFTTHCIQSVK